MFTVELGTVHGPLAETQRGKGSCALQKAQAFVPGCSGGCSLSPKVAPKRWRRRAAKSAGREAGREGRSQRKRSRGIEREGDDRQERGGEQEGENQSASIEDVALCMGELPLVQSLSLSRPKVGRRSPSPLTRLSTASPSLPPSLNICPFSLSLSLYLSHSLEQPCIVCKALGPGGFSLRSAICGQTHRCWLLQHHPLEQPCATAKRGHDTERVCERERAWEGERRRERGDDSKDRSMGQAGRHDTEQAKGTGRG